MKTLINLNSYRRKFSGFSIFLFICIMLALSKNTNGQGTGLVGHYYSNDGPDYKFTAQLTLKRVDPIIQFQWGGGSPAPGVINPESFSIRWIGKIVPKVTGNHTFFLRADDGVRLKINEQLIIDSWIPSAGGTRTSSVLNLIAGKKYDVIIEYYEGGGGAQIEFSWQAPGLVREVVPTSQLYPQICSDLKNSISPENQAFCKSGPIQPLTGDFNNLDLFDEAYYVWESSEDLINWNVIAGAKDQNLPVAVQDKDRWYRRLIKSKTSFLCDTLQNTDQFLVSISNVAFVKGSPFTAPKVDAGKNLYACPDVPVKIGGNPSATGEHPPFTYNWDFGEFLSNKTIPNPIASVPSNTIFTLTVTDAVGCTNLHQMVLYTYPADGGSDKKYCGDENSLTLGTPANPGEPATYLWSPKDNLTCFDCPQTSTNTKTSTFYILQKTVTLPDGATCQTRDTVFIEVIAPPSNKLEDVIICYSDNNEVEIGYVPENSYSYVWKTTDFLKDINLSLATFDCDDLFLDPQGRLGNPKKPNPASYILEIQKEGCKWLDTLQLFMLRADGGNSGLDGKLGYDWHPQIPATYKWKAVAGPNTISGPDNKAVVLLDPADPSSVYQLSVSFRGVGCVSRNYKCEGGGLCGINIEYYKDCIPRPGLQLRVEGGMSLPLGANPADFKYEWFPKTGLSSYFSQKVTTTDNVKRKYQVMITHPDRPGAVCLTEREIPVTQNPEVILPESYLVCKPGDTVEIGITPSAFHKYIWKGPNNFSSDTSLITVMPTSLPATFNLTVIDTSNFCETTVSTEIKVAVEADAGEDQTVCPGAIVSLGTPDKSGGSWSYNWQPFYSPWQEETSETSPQPAVLVAEDLVFVLTVTDTSSGCTDVDSVNIYMDPNGPSIEFEDVVACLKSKVAIGPAPIPFAKYKWSPAEGLSCTDCPNPIIEAVNNAEYSVEILLSGNCSQLFFGNVKVNVFDTTTLFESPVNKCPSSPGGDVVLNPDKKGECASCMYEWSPAEGLDNPDIINPVAFADKDQVYTLTVSNETGCSRTIKVPVRIFKTESLGTENIVKCPNEKDVYLNDKGLGDCSDCTYSWVPADGLDNPKALNPKTTISNNTKYTLYSTKSDGCMEKLDVNVQVKPEVTLPSIRVEKCPTGDPLPLNPDKTGECTGCTYEWSPLTYLDNTNTINPLSSAPKAIDYQFKIIKEDGCIEIQAVIVRPVITSAGMNENICLGNSLILGDAGNSTTSIYNWTPSTNLDNASSRLPKFTPETDGIFIYKMTEERDIDGKVCKLTSEIKINVEKISVPSLSGPLTICKGTCSEIGVDSLPGYKYLWSGPFDLDCSTCSKITVCPEIKSLYQLTTIKIDNGCSASSEMYVDIADVVLPEFEIPELAACLGNSDNIKLNPTPSTPGNYKIRWFPENYFDNPNSGSPSLYTDSLTVGSNIIEFWVDDLTSGCKNIRYQTEVNIFDPSSVKNQTQQICKDVQTNELSISLNEFDNLFKEYDSYKISYYHSENDAELGMGQIQNSIKLSKDTTIYVRVEFPEANCHVVTSLFLDTRSSYNRIIEKNLCEGDTYTFDNTILSESGIYNFSYKTAQDCDSLYVIKLNVEKIVKNASDTVICRGDFIEFNGSKYFEEVTLLDTLFNRFGCDSIHTSIKLSIKELGYTQLEEVKCGKFTWEQTGLTYDKSGVYTDTIKNLAACDSIISLRIKINPEYYFTENFPAECGEFFWEKSGELLVESGTYYRKLKTKIGGCDSIYQLNVTINPIFEKEETVEVFENYYWPVNKITYDESGEFIEIFKTESGCDSIITLRLNVKKYGKIWIPNIFSPNGDGSNDRFYIFSNPEVVEIKLLRIYSRTGNLVFEKMNFTPNEPENGWDGTFLNRPLDPAVFTFLVEWEDIYGYNQTDAGSLQLLR